MNRFAATLMALACLLYAAIPLAAAPVVAVAEPAMVMAHDHGGHDAAMKNMAAMDHSSHSGKSSTPCPHGGKGCVTPFCAACLVLLPELMFQRQSRIAFSYPAPSPAPAMVPHVPGLDLPPPRA